MTAGLALYRAAATTLGPLAGPLLSWRARAGKEDPVRLGERFGVARRPRPEGPVCWLHGASVGETRVVLTVREALAAARPDLEFLITSGTMTSAALLTRAPPRTRHQFVPIDRPDVAARFIAHWRPDLAVFAESDLWPHLLIAAHKAGARLALVNARMSPRSLANWARWGASARALLGRFDALIAADTRTAHGLSAVLRRDVPMPGNLKLCAPPPAVDPAAAASLATAIGGRPVWLAASTHAGEDEIVLAAHAEIRARIASALLIIAPRHPERGGDVAACAAQVFGQSPPRRSQGAAPDAGPVYVADTMGEMGALYARSDLALIAGSLKPELKGHNPVEPARLGTPILAGPHVESFADVYAGFREKGALREVATAEDIAAAVIDLLGDPNARRSLAAAAADAVSNGGAALETTVDALLPLLPPAAHAAA